ncbi:MAG: uroporphyrinogen-III synthase [Methanomethylovorans sp.]|nr:uroporphyrinogen-III synthase [Methanomethylovorans sp.]
MTSEKRPVIAIMRPTVYKEESVRLAESMGFDAIAVPMIELAGMEDSSFKPFFERIVKKEADYVIFTSANGLDFTLRKIPYVMRDMFIEALNRTNVIAIGPTTKKALEEKGIKVMGMPGVYSSKGLVEYLCNDVKGKKVNLARSVFGSTVLTEGLIRCGADVLETKVYSLFKPDGAEQKDLIRSAMEGKITAFAFTSSMMVHNFFEVAKEMEATASVIEALNGSIVAAIGLPTAETLRSYRVSVSVIPDEYTFEEVLRKIRDMLSACS